MDPKLEVAFKQYQAQLASSKKYYDKLKQAKVEAGTYKGRGRPRKTPEVKGV
jgi:hypothetical protein